MEPKRCHLAGTVFFGAIMVTNGSKSKKKMHTRRNRRQKEAPKIIWREKVSVVGIYRGLEYESLRRRKGPFAMAKRCSLRRRPSFTATNRASLLRIKRCGPSSSPWRTRGLVENLVPSAAAKQASPWQTRKYGHYVFELHL